MLEEKKDTPAIQVFRHRELAQKIATLTEDIEELKSEKSLLLSQLNCVDNHGMTEVKQRIASMESSLERLNQQETRYTDELDVALAEYAALQQQAADMAVVELDTARQGVRPDKERETAQRLQSTYGKQFNSKMLAQSRKDVASLLGETAEPVFIRQKLQQPVEQQSDRHYAEKQDQER